jgi:hypothetical protein
MRKRFLPILFVSLLVAGSAAVVQAKPSEYDLIVRHLKSKYQAKKDNIPFIWLARAAVSMVRPAGVRSFSVTLFHDLKFSRENLDLEMQAAMRSSFGEQWSPIFHVRSKEGQQAYMYMRESNNCVRIALVTIDKENAAVIRATFRPEKLADFINDPKILGISLNDKNDKDNDTDNSPDQPQQPAAPEKKDN